MISDFILPYSQLNLASLIFEQKKTIWETRLINIEAIEIFKYGKNNDGY